MKTYMPLNGLRWSRNSGSANCDMPQSTVFGRPGGDESLVRIRRLTPTECARLQTVPDWYKWAVSETQQYKMLGSGWTVEVIKHIFSFLPDNLLKK